MPQARPTTLLAHHAPTGFHYDWLIDPPQPEAATTGHPEPRELPKLWTARVGLLWEDWAAAGVITAHALPPHRRRYLNWSGPLSGDRGHVAVAARGHLTPRTWGNTRIDATLTAGPVLLDLALSRPSVDTTDWRVVVTPITASELEQRAIS